VGVGDDCRGCYDPVFEIKFDITVLRIEITVFEITVFEVKPSYLKGKQRSLMKIVIGTFSFENLLRIKKLHTVYQGFRLDLLLSHFLLELRESRKERIKNVWVPI